MHASFILLFIGSFVYLFIQSFELTDNSIDNLADGPINIDDPGWQGQERPRCFKRLRPAAPCGLTE